jgi:nucleoside-diphosphate kinase
MAKKCTDNIEQTLIIFKPDAVQRGLVGEILTRFERVGLKIVGMKMISPDRDAFYHHYETIGQVKSRRGEDTLNIVIDFMMDGPVIAAGLEGVEAISVVRKIVGSTEPKSSPIGTIRGDYCHISYGRADITKKGVPNLIHASEGPKDAAQEIDHWFSDSELFDYETLNEKFTR